MKNNRLLEETRQKHYKNVYIRRLTETYFTIRNKRLQTNQILFDVVKFQCETRNKYAHLSSLKPQQRNERSSNTWDICICVFHKIKIERLDLNVECIRVVAVLPGHMAYTYAAKAMYTCVFGALFLLLQLLITVLVLSHCWIFRLFSARSPPTIRYLFSSFSLYLLTISLFRFFVRSSPSFLSQRVSRGVY